MDYVVASFTKKGVLENGVPVDKFLSDSVDRASVLLSTFWLHHGLVYGTSEIRPLFPLPAEKSTLLFARLSPPGRV